MLRYLTSGACYQSQAASLRHAFQTQAISAPEALARTLRDKSADGEVEWTAFVKMQAYEINRGTKPPGLQHKADHKSAHAYHSILLCEPPEMGTGGSEQKNTIDRADELLTVPAHPYSLKIRVWFRTQTFHQVDLTFFGRSLHTSICPVHSQLVQSHVEMIAWLYDTEKVVGAHE